MHIEIWSDFVCPFCFIGKKRLEAALEDFHGKDQVKITYKSYQLDPNTPAYDGVDYLEGLAKKFGSIEQAKQMTTNIIEQAKTVGLDFNFDHAKLTNTLDAHRLNKLAEQEQKQALFSDLLFRAHFIEGKDVGDDKTLTQIAVEAGMDTTRATSVLNDTSLYHKEVQTDIQEAAQFGISGVPYFVINRKYAVSGAQPVAAFTQTLEQVWQEENKPSPLQDLSTANGNTGDACGADGCAIPKDKS